MNCIGKSVEEQLRYEILSGRMPPGNRFPYVRALAQKTKCSANVAHHAVSALKKQGLLQQKSRLFYVTEDDSLIQRLRRAECCLLTKELLSTLCALGFSRQEILELLSAE